jgi:hypothetical protein
MKYRGFLAGLAMALAVTLSPARDAQAAAVFGSQTFFFLGGASADTGNINTADFFTLDSMGAEAGANNQKGDFATYVTSLEAFGSPVLTVNPLSQTFSFGNVTFGTFTATSITQTSSGPTNQDYDLKGTFVPGTDFLGLFSTGTAEVTLGFTQADPGVSVISVSGTLFSPSAAAVPEPASIVLGFTSFVGFGLAFGLRRRFSKATV